MSSNTRGCNHVQLNPHISMHKSKFAANARAHKDGQRRQRNCRRDCRDSRASYPRRNAHRCARCRVSTGPDTKRWYTPVGPHASGPPVGTNRTVCKKQARSSASSKKSTAPRWNGLQQRKGGYNTRAAAVQCCRAYFPCASPLAASSVRPSSSSSAGLRFRLYLKSETRTMELGRTNLALKYGEAKKQLYQSERTGDQASIDSDVDEIRLRHEGTQILPAGVNRECLKFAGICIGNEGKVSAALVKAVTGSRSKLRNRMIPFLNSPLVTP